MSISTYLVLILIVIVINAVKSAQKKKEAEEARRMPTAKAQQPKPSVPQVHSQLTKPTASMPPEMPAHVHTTVHAAHPKVHEHLAAACDRDAELQGSMAYDSPEGRDLCHADELFPAHENRPEVPHEEVKPGLKLDFSPNAMVQAMVMQEVLTRPCERRKR